MYNVHTYKNCFINQCLLNFLIRINILFYTFQTSSPNDAQGRNSNSHIMDYLRRIVPRMFQNTLSLLSRQIIQQFLDELVWRECYGVTPGQAFDNVVQHLAEQTKIEDPENLIARLNRVAANPFKQWDFGVDEVIPSSSGAGAKKKRKPNVREPC